MPRDPRKYLHDIQDSCTFLLEFTAGRTLPDYEADRGFRSAVQRELQIIGEALAQLDRLAPQMASRINEYRRIIRFRNVLVHGYDTLKPDLVWYVVENKLAVLKNEVEELLAGNT